jgi:hypothetical protein
VHDAVLELLLQRGALERRQPAHAGGTGVVDVLLGVGVKVGVAVGDAGEVTRREPLFCTRVFNFRESLKADESVGKHGGIGDPSPHGDG